jgi:hypothetical protein
MEHPIRTGPSLDRVAFREIRREMELSHCKGDGQVGDLTAIADFFHYTTDGWRVLEVNSTETTSFTKLVASCVVRELEWA